MPTISDLKLCADALAAKYTRHAQRWRYYDGDHPIAFRNQRMIDVIPNTVVFKENWCQVIVNTSRDRLQIQAWNYADDAIREAAETIWKHTLKRPARQVHVSALVTGEAYVVLGIGDDCAPCAHYHDPSQTHVVYEEDDPDTPRVACKTWIENKKRRMNLYYIDRIERYHAERLDATEAGAYRLIDGDTGPGAGIEPWDLGFIPVFRFVADSRALCGELSIGVISLQDAVNKVLNDMMVSSEYNAFQHKWAIGNFDTASKPPQGPGIVTTFPGGAQGDQATSVGAFPASDPNNYLNPMQSLTRAMSVLSATPKHYFDTQSGDPSGEALSAMEAPLIAKIEAYQEALGETWQRVMSGCLAMAGANVPHTDIECMWKSPHTVQPKSQAETWLVKTQAGIPIANVLRDEGWTSKDIEQLHEDMNVAATVTQIPNVGALPAGIPEPVRIAAVAKARDTMTAKATRPMTEALAGMGEIPTDAIAGVMDKWQGRQVRK